MSYTEDFYAETLNGEYVEDFLEDDDFDIDDESFSESDDEPEYDSFSEEDDTDYEDEAIRIPRFISRAYRRFKSPRVSIKHRNYNRRIGRSYQGSGVIRTPAGNARIRLPRNLATKSEMKNALAAVGRDIQRNARGIVKINTNLNRLDRRYGTISKSLAKNARKADKLLSSMQQQQLMTALLPPKLEEIQVVEDVNGTPTKKTLTVDSTKFDTTTTLLLAMMGGGMGSTGSNNNMMMPMMLMALDDDNDDDNKTMFLMMAMMMGQQK